MKKTDPIMFSQAISHASDPGSSSKTGPSARMAYALETRNRIEPTKSGTQTRCRVWVRREGRGDRERGAGVEGQRAGKLGGRRQPAAVSRSAKHAAGPSGAVRSSGPGAISGLWDWTSCANEALVKKIDPMKYVTASVTDPTAFT